VDVDRDAYGISSAVFSDLPPIPSCFQSVVDRYQDGRFADAYFFTPAYYLQPEFFPNFVTSGLSQWQSPDASHYGVVGFGGHPATHRSGVLIGGQKSFRFFINSGFGVRGYQAGRLEAVLVNPQDAPFVKVTLDEDSANGFLLGPTFPRFSPLWVHVVDVNVSFSKDAAYKDYVISFRSAEVSEEWFDAHNPPSATYYYNITDFVGPRPAFTLTVVPS
jgi:hypothetical protein